MIKRILVLIVFIFSMNIHSQTDTLNLYYDIGIYKLNKKNYNVIQSKLNSLIDSVSYQVEIISSCDFLGTNKSNLTLSLNRAVTVKNLLEIKENLAITSITYKGIGEILSTKKNIKGVKNHRKTTLIFKDETQVVLDSIVQGKKGDIFVLRDIIFEPGRHFLRPESIAALKRLLLIMKRHPKLKIELSGHVCCGKNKSDFIDGYDKDSETYNLSENRAQHIYKYLILKKINPSRLSFKGYGFQRPLYYPEENLFHKKMNRRVEIKVIDN